MRHALFAIFLLAPLAPSAQVFPYEPPGAEGPAPADPAPGEDSFGSLFERGAESLLHDLFDEIEPHMNAIGDKLGGRLNALAPVFDDLGRLMDDLENYQPPERLANGDILIRRKPGAPPPPPVGEDLQDLVEPPSETDPRDEPRLVPPPPSGHEVEL